MPKRYALPGPVARALEVTGDRWTLLVIRELLLGCARYADLERALPGIPSNLLAERLRLLEDEAIAYRGGNDRAYRLTSKGRELAPVLASLAAWGLRYYGAASSARAVHAGCGGPVHTRSTCARCGAVVAPAELDLRGRAGTAQPRHQLTSPPSPARR
ncbi:MAG TPA: helix-turn-helix domain-containing protein [Actinomycetota bacterium]|jgi:DNA-binding HxlR family transcriptional regulator|nr:helix-turn-helix domain-containing protein [Actinomycetota bacterium]